EARPGAFSDRRRRAFLADHCVLDWLYQAESAGAGVGSVRWGWCAGRGLFRGDHHHNWTSIYRSAQEGLRPVSLHQRNSQNQRLGPWPSVRLIGSLKCPEISRLNNRFVRSAVATYSLPEEREVHLNVARIPGGRADSTELRGSDRRAWKRELRVVEQIEEFR